MTSAGCVFDARTRPQPPAKAARTPSTSTTLATAGSVRSRAVTAALRARPDVRDVVDVDGVRASFGDGWGLVRASNTQAVLVMRCEASDLARLAIVRRTIEDELALARATVEARPTGGTR